MRVLNEGKAPAVNSGSLHDIMLAAAGTVDSAAQIDDYLDLRRVVFVNWYLYGAREFDVRGDIAMLGANGAGKTSMVDGIQTGLTGGVHNAYNAATTNSSAEKRVLAEYCLGIVAERIKDAADREHIQEVSKPREACLTHIGLVFKNSYSGKTLSLAVSIDATLHPQEAKVVGRLVLPGVEVKLADFIREVDGGHIELPADEVRAGLKKRLAEAHHKSFAYYSGEAYINNWLLHASPDSHRFRIQPKAFLNSLRNGLKLRNDYKDPDKFVKDCLLPVPENMAKVVEEMRVPYRTWKDILGKIKEARFIIEAAEKAMAIATEFVSRRNRALGQNYAALSIQRDIASSKLDELEIDNEEDTAELSRIEGELADKREVLGSARLQLAASVAAYEKSDYETAISFHKQKQNDVREKLKAPRQIIQAHNDKLAAIVALGRIEHKNSELAGLVVAAQSALELGGGTLWPGKDAVRAAAVTTQAAGGFDRLKASIKSEHEKLTELKGKDNEQIAELRREREALSGGKVVLRDSTRELQEALKKELGLEAELLCDLIRIKGEADGDLSPWRDACETLLGGLRESLVLPKEATQRAVSWYRANGRRFYGARIIGWEVIGYASAKKMAANCLSGCIETEHPLARAYVDLKLGSVRMVEDHEDIYTLDARRAVTIGCFYKEDGVYSAIKALPPMIGVHAKARRRAELDGIIEKREKANGTYKERVDELYTLAGRVAAVAEILATDCGDLVKAVATRETLNSIDAAATSALELVQKDSDSEKLEASVKKLETEVLTLAGEITTAESAVSVLTRKIGAFEGSSAAQKKLIALHSKSMAALEAESHFSLEDANRAREDFERRNPNADIVETFETLTRLSNENRNKAELRYAEFFSACFDFHAKYGSLKVAQEERDFDVVRSALVATRDYVRDTEMAQYENAAEEALRTTEQTFKSKMTGMIGEQFSESDRIVKELNQSLRTMRLTNHECYEIVKDENKALEEIRLLIEEVRNNPIGAGELFSQDGEGAMAEAGRQLLEYLERGSELEIIADYRNYYTYNVLVKDANTGKRIDSMRNRLCKGSGGEKQTPFYVMACTAFRQTYHLGAMRGGLRLAIFDEVFSNLDNNNCEALMTLFTLFGLQLFICAPADKGGVIDEHVDTHMEIWRDGARVSIQTSFLSEAAHELLASGRPVLAAPAAAVAAEPLQTLIDFTDSTETANDSISA